MIATPFIGCGLLLLIAAFFFCDYYAAWKSMPKVSRNERMKRVLRNDVDFGLALPARLVRWLKPIGVRALNRTYKPTMMTEGEGHKAGLVAGTSSANPTDAESFEALPTMAQENSISLNDLSSGRPWVVKADGSILWDDEARACFNFLEKAQN
jgi:hypothetical protein